MESTGNQTLTILQTCHKDKRKAMARLPYVTQYIYTVLCIYKYLYLHTLCTVYIEIFIYMYFHVCSTRGATAR